MPDSHSSPILQIKFKLEFPNPPVFHRWLPIDPGDAIEIEEENGIRFKIYATEESAWWASKSTREEILRTHNNYAHRLSVEVSTPISKELDSFIRERRREPETLASEYKSLGEALQSVIVKRVNRFVQYASAMKGQFWVEELQPDTINPGQFFMRLKTSATIDGDVVRFDPDNSTVVLIGSVEEVDYMFVPDDWTKVQAFVAGDKRPPLIETLLASAFSLAAKGNRRNALVEAVTALEVALNRFVKNTENLAPNRFSGRVQTAKINRLIDKVGLRGAFDVAIPLLLDEAEMPLRLLKICREAIDRRNNIAHNGTRDIEPSKLDSMLRGIKETCEIFQSVHRRKPD